MEPSASPLAELRLEVATLSKELRGAFIGIVLRAATKAANVATIRSLSDHVASSYRERSSGIVRDFACGKRSQSVYM